MKHARNILPCAIGIAVVAWASRRVWWSFSPVVPKAVPTVVHEPAAVFAQTRLEQAQKESVVALGDEKHKSMRTEIDRLLAAAGVATSGLGDAVTRRLGVMFSGTWDEYCSYVKDVSTFGEKANLSLRDESTWRDAREMPLAVVGGYSHRKDDGLYSAVNQSIPREMIVQVDIPARVLEPLAWKTEIDAVLVMEFAFAGSRWVPWRTGLRFPIGYDGPTLVPWL